MVSITGSNPVLTTKTINMCKHKNLEYIETIVVSSHITICEHDELGEVLDCTDNYKSRTGEEVYCFDCGIGWHVNNRVPKRIKEFVQKINELKDKT
jgi:hypothetical protein